MSGLIRRIAGAALRKLAEQPEDIRPQFALPAPSSLTVQRPQRQAPPLLHGVPVFRDAPPALAPAPPQPVPAVRRRKTITVIEETYIRRG